MNAPSFLTASALVAIGGGFGSWLRYLVGGLTSSLIGPSRASDFPWATLSVNVLGSFAMGLLVGWMARYGQGGQDLRLLLGVGLLGGFTTFSTFALEFALFIERGAIASAMGYVGLSLLAGFAGLFLGLMLMRGAL